MKHFLILAAVFSTTYSAVDYSHVKFIFVGNSISDTVTLQHGGNFGGLAAPYFDKNKKSMIYINSFRQDYSSFDAELMVNAYLTRKAEWNIIYLDWSNYTNNFVLIPTIMQLPGISATAASILSDMKTAGLLTPPNIFLGIPGSYIHIIGFGLGAHLAGYIGRHYSAINRITGLDPMGFFMYTSVIATSTGLVPLRYLDAVFVDIIHTSAGKFGYPVSQGKIDFWPNGGQSQAGCTFIQSIKDFLENQDISNIYTLACTHTRAVYYYVESVYRNSSSLPFISSFCPLGSAVNAASCTNNRGVSMGYFAAVPGICATPGFCPRPDLYLDTNPASPFSLT